MVEREIQDVLDRFLTETAPEDWDTEGLRTEVATMLPPPADLTPDEMAQMAQEEIEERYLSHARAVYDQLEERLTPEFMRPLERQLLLRAIDSNWVQHLTSMENLRQGIGLHAFGQRDPLVMYKKEGHEMFQNLQERIQEDIVHTVFRVELVPQAGRGDGRRKAAHAKTTTVMSRAIGNRDREAVPAGERKVGRNVQCPCGSGKKYKRCHGASRNGP